MANHATGPNSSANGATPSTSARGRAAARPIAASLALGPQHDGLIEQSHQRCTALGLSRIERPDHAPLGRPDLTVARDRNRRLHNHAAPVMEMLAEQIVGTESMVVLCDSTGTIIHSIGDDNFLSRASQVALQPGVNWSEPAKGTNAIGTALIVESPTLVHADEHFMHANHFLTCSAAPILDPRGHVLGVLDVTGDQRSYHPHTMALVKMSARMIENHWLSDDQRNAMRLHFHHRPEFIDTLMEGILAVAPDGRIVGANRSALEQLGLSGAALRQHSLGSLFGTTVGALVDRFRSPLATPMPVQAASGRGFHIHARVNWSAWGSVAAPAAPPAALTAAVALVDAAAATPQPAAQGSALQRWLTGDAQVAAVVAKLQRVLDRQVPITLVGDTGTGKECLARALHQDSARSARALVVMRCAGLPPHGGDELARCVAQAQGSTLLLDDVGDLPAALQARLLRLLDGTDDTPPDLALICTSTQALTQTALRADLQHRLGGLSVVLPPLRERSDLQALAQRLLEEAAADGGGGSPPPQLSSEALALLQAHPWPGNLRELHTLLRTAVLLAAPQPCITPEHLPDALRQGAQPPGQEPSPRAAVGQGTAGQSLQAQSLQAVELQALRAAVDAAGGNIALAARRLGVGRNTIYRKLRWGRNSAGR